MPKTSATLVLRVPAAAGLGQKHFSQLGESNFFACGTYRLLSDRAEVRAQSRSANDRIHLNNVVHRAIMRATVNRPPARFNTPPTYRVTNPGLRTQRRAMMPLFHGGNFIEQLL
jgi:hypothetical protein